MKPRYIYLCDGMKKECRDSFNCAVNFPETGMCEHTVELRHAKNAMRILNGQAEFIEEPAGDNTVYWEVDYLQ